MEHPFHCFVTYGKARTAQQHCSVAAKVMGKMLILSGCLQEICPACLHIFDCGRQSHVQAEGTWSLQAVLSSGIKLNLSLIRCNSLCCKNQLKKDMQKLTLATCIQRSRILWQVQPLSEILQLRNGNWWIVCGADQPGWSHYSTM